MSNRELDVARRYHEITKHSFTSVRSDPHALDWENRPLAYKIYPPPADRAATRTGPVADASDSRDCRRPRRSWSGHGRRPAIRSRHDHPPAVLRRGLTRSKSVGGEAYHFRAAASAGALYPIEVYLAATDVAELTPGLYHFSPADLKLRGLRRGDWRRYLARASAMRPALAEARAILGSPRSSGAAHGSTAHAPTAIVFGMPEPSSPTS